MAFPTSQWSASSAQAYLSRIASSDPTQPAPSSTVPPPPSQPSSNQEVQNGQLWSNRFRKRNDEQPTKTSAPVLKSCLKPKKAPLGERAHNVAMSTSTLGLASPFVPSTDSVWGPPDRVSAQPSPEERLAAMEARVQELTSENEKLKAQQVLIPSPSPSPFTSPAYRLPNVPPPAPSFFSNGFGRGMSNFGRRFGDEDFFSQARDEGRYHDGSDGSRTTQYTPDTLRNDILSGKFVNGDIPVDCVESMVALIAYHQPRGQNETAGLKAAVGALADRVGYPRSLNGVSVLIDSIIDLAKPLCFTSSGNYLCQQLLERGDPADRMAFIERIKDDLVNIASDRFGTHVLYKAVAIKELEEPIASALLAAGIYDSMRTGARRLWPEYLEKRRQAKDSDIFLTINQALDGRWADLACSNEHGSIAVQQVLEVFGSPALMQPCVNEILADFIRVGNDQFGHFVINKLFQTQQFLPLICDKILNAYPPMATTHHGASFIKLALTAKGRPAVMKYVEDFCTAADDRTPGLVPVASSSMGKNHLMFLSTCITDAELAKIKQVSLQYSTTLRNTQSGNDWLRMLNLINTPHGRRGLPMSFQGIVSRAKHHHP